MENKSLEIKTATIEIKVVRVDGHKMTKAVFRQIEDDEAFEVCEKQIVPCQNTEILGWVNENNGIYWLHQTKGRILKDLIKIRRQITVSGGVEIVTGESVFMDGQWMETRECNYFASLVRLKAKYPQLFIAT